MAHTNGAVRPHEDALVVTKINAAPLPTEEFHRRLDVLKAFRDAANEAAGKAAAAIVRYAVEYAAIYAEVRSQQSRVIELNRALNVSEFAATRLRTIAGQSAALIPIQSFLPATLEQIYEVTLAVKKNPDAVRRALTDGRLTPDSTCKVVRAIKAFAGIRLNGSKVRRSCGPRTRPALRRNPGNLWEGKHLVKMLSGVVPGQCAVWLRMHTDAQWYGTTVICTFIATNVALQADGQLPEGMDSRIARAARIALAAN